MNMWTLLTKLKFRHWVFIYLIVCSILAALIINYIPGLIMDITYINMTSPPTNDDLLKEAFNITFNNSSPNSTIISQSFINIVNH